MNTNINVMKNGNLKKYDNKTTPIIVTIVSTNARPKIRYLWIPFPGGPLRFLY